MTRSAHKPTPFEDMHQFWVKNKQLKRPVSPHLTVYKPHLTMTLSISNRVFACVLQALITLGGIAALSGATSYSDFLKKVKSSPGGPAFIAATKFIVSLSLAYHLAASVRHYVWDCGIGYTKNMTMQSSRAIVVATALITAALYLYKPPMPTVVKRAF